MRGELGQGRTRSSSQHIGTKGVARVAVLAGVGLIGVGIAAQSSLPNPLRSANPSGTASTFSTAGPIEVSNPFFEELGSNGRTCNSCHVSSAAWSVTPAEIQERFTRTQGMDPIFRPVDGANCPSADTSSVAARRSAYSMLLEKGLIRVSVAVPANADFQIIGIDDPYDCRETTAQTPALYRRPLPSTNLPFLTTVMWDGRESPAGQSLEANLAQQAIDATLGHAEASRRPSVEQLRQIVEFETALFTAQETHNRAGALVMQGAKGGAVELSKQEFYAGINDPLGGNPTGAPFDPRAFTIFKAWENDRSATKAAVARGQELFNTLPIAITEVTGLNDVLGAPVINGTCTTCHDAPNVGNHSVPLAINIGVADPGAAGLDTAGLPVYTIRCNAGGAILRTTDPGRALVTGKCADVGKFKGPVLRGLAARAPYFHNGSAATLADVLNFYEVRFHVSLSVEQKADLVAFLQTL